MIRLLIDYLEAILTKSNALIVEGKQLWLMLMSLEDGFLSWRKLAWHYEAFFLN